ncbi:MAG TPA: glycosyltransferase family 2 protein [Pseudomonadales bacterium]
MVRFSIVIPVYNNLPGIVRCLDSLCRQSYPASSFEVVVVDNNSSPPLVLTENYPFSCRVVWCGKPGAYAARNAGAAEARFEWLVFTDADCVADEQWLENASRAIGCHGDSAFLGGEVLYLPVEKTTPVSLYQSAIGFQQQENIQWKHFSATANLFCRRSQFDHVGPFDEELLSGGDRLWCWQAKSEGYQLHFCDKAVIYTEPRTDLVAAMIQARRVAGGRYILRKKMKENNVISEQHVMPHRGLLAAIGWLMSYPFHSKLDRAKVLVAAVMIRLAQMTETLLIKLGKKPERR